MRNVRLSGISLALISALAAAGCAMAQSNLPPAAAPAMQAQQTAGVSVMVVDPTGAVIPHANIQLQKEHGESVANGITNQAGLAALANVPAGSYVMQVSAQGFKTERQSVDVKPGNVMAFQIKLPVGSCSPCVEVVPGPNFVEIDHSTETEVQPISYVQLIQLPPHQSNWFRRFLGKIGHGLGF